MQMRRRRAEQHLTLARLSEFHTTRHWVARIAHRQITRMQGKVAQSLDCMPIGQLNLVHATGAQVIALMQPHVIARPPWRSVSRGINQQHSSLPCGQPGRRLLHPQQFA